MESYVYKTGGTKGPEERTAVRATAKAQEAYIEAMRKIGAVKRTYTNPHTGRKSYSFERAGKIESGGKAI